MCYGWRWQLSLTGYIRGVRMQTHTPISQGILKNDNGGLMRLSVRFWKTLSWLIKQSVNSSVTRSNASTFLRKVSGWSNNRKAAAAGCRATKERSAALHRFGLQPDSSLCCWGWGIAEHSWVRRLKAVLSFAVPSLGQFPRAGSSKAIKRL